MSTSVRESIAMTCDTPRGHSREGGNPVQSVHPELVEGFINAAIEWFDKLTMSANNWIPAFAGMTTSMSIVESVDRTIAALFINEARVRD
jgi:hypothetical protein